MLAEIEQDFIEFMATRNNESFPDVQKRYEASKQAIDFGGKEFGDYGLRNCQVLQVFFGTQNERLLFESYRYYAYMSILRMLSYSFPKTSTPGGYIRTCIKALTSGDIEKIASFLKRKMLQEKKKPLVELVLDRYESPTILDYGCGLGYLSFAMAQKSPSSKVILVDLDTIKLDFTEFRFKKHGINFETVRIGIDNPYPTLPEHTVCIATDVMEHLQKPILAYEHIRDSMQAGGTLYGNFEDHNEEMFHVHPHLAELRNVITKDYVKVAPNLYKKLPL